MDFLQPIVDKLGMGYMGYYVLIIPTFFIISIIFQIILKNKNKNEGTKFLQENPTAAKIYIDHSQGFIHNNNLRIITVDDDYLKAKLYFEKNGKQAIYLLPGEHVIESEFTSSRPGILHKRVTKIYGPDKNSVKIEKNKEYIFKFDPKQETYLFEEKKDA